MEFVFHKALKDGIFLYNKDIPAKSSASFHFIYINLLKSNLGCDTDLYVSPFVYTFCNVPQQDDILIEMVLGPGVCLSLTKFKCCKELGTTNPCQSPGFAVELEPFNG